MSALMLCLLLVLFSIILPAALWVYYCIQNEKGWLTIFYGMLAYLGLQLILRISFLTVINWLIPLEGDTLSFVSSLVSSLLNTLGLSLLFWVFYRPKMTPAKATGFALGFACFEPMLLFGVNGLLSLVLNMVLPDAYYLGGTVESIYQMSSLFFMITLLAFALQKNKKELWIITVVLWVAVNLLDTWIFSSLSGSLGVEIVVFIIQLALWGLLWKQFAWADFYGTYIRNRLRS